MPSRPLLLAALLVSPLASVAQQKLTTPQQEFDKLQAKYRDFGGLSRYAAENTRLGPPVPGVKRVVFFGDSITDFWGRQPNRGQFFPGKPYVNRGISGQTTPQMLIRFEQDVVRLKPAAVVILAGINDLAQNTGAETMDFIQDNFRAMVAIAKSAHIRVILASVLPAERFTWKSAESLHPAAQVRALNAWLADFCKAQRLTFLNYYPAMVNATGGMRPELAVDQAIHPNDAGYAIMQPLAENAIAKALASSAP